MRRYSGETDCWCCDGEKRVFDTARRRSAKCDECNGTGKIAGFEEKEVDKDRER